MSTPLTTLRRLKLLSVDDRYSRQVILPEIGPKGQECLRQAVVGVVGCGGLGAIASAYLAGAGVGHIILIDGDEVSLSNLHRQVFFSTHQTQLKTAQLKAHLNALNPEVDVTEHAQFLTRENCSHLLGECQVVLECTDQLDVKFLVNDYCAMKGIPLVFGAVYKFEGYISSFANASPDDTHLRDIYTDSTDTIPSCEEVGVMNTVAGIIGLHQANEAIKIISKMGQPLFGTLLWYDVLTLEQRKITLAKSFRDDMARVFKENAYDNAVFCDNSIDIDRKDIRDDMVLVSIVENSEHLGLTPNTIHKPMSRFDPSFLDDHYGKTVVLCCNHGISSRALAIKLARRFTSIQFKSLKGGLMAMSSKEMH